MTARRAKGRPLAARRLLADLTIARANPRSGRTRATSRSGCRRGATGHCSRERVALVLPGARPGELTMDETQQERPEVLGESSNGDLRVPAAPRKYGALSVIAPLVCR